MRTTLAAILAMTPLLGGVTACDGDGKPHAPPASSPSPSLPSPSPSPTSPSPSPTSPSPSASPSPSPPATAARHVPGPAYIGVDDVGLFRLENGTLTRIIDHEYPFHSIVVDANGVVYASAIGGLWRIEHGRKNRLDDELGQTYEFLALGPDGVLWASDRRAVHRWDGTWTHEPADTFDNALVEDIAVDFDGRVWVATSAALWRLDGASWSKLDPSFTGNDQPFFSSLEVGADGAVYVACLYGTFVYRDGRWLDTQMSSITRNIDALAAGPAGHVAGSGGVGGIAIAAPGAPLWKNDISDGADAHRADVRAIDGAGRLWVTTDNGLVILDAHGGLVQQWLPGTVAGVDGTVTAIAVVDDGPALPTLRAAATGTITGRVLRHGKPVGNAGVELCDMPLITFQSTPCGSATFTRTATTNADGVFRLPDVPIGSYSFAIKPDGQWRVMMGGSNCCSRLEPGGSFDVGAITVD